MKKHIYFTLGALLFLLSSCFYDRLESSSSSIGEQDVILSLNVGASSDQLSSSNPEDKINQVSVFIADSQSGRIVFQTSMTKLFKLNIRLVVGTYDFYFIANLDNMDHTVFSSRSELDDYVKYKRSLRDNTLTTVIPMSRIYKNQVLTAGGTIASPLPFVPQLDADKQLAPVSSYGVDYAEPSFASLVRALAKISIKFSGMGINRINKVSLMTSTKTYSLWEEKVKPGNVSTNEIIFNKKELTSSGLSYNPVYIPERIFESKDGLGWNRDKDNGIDEPRGGVYYIKVEMDQGDKIYKIPVISNAIPSSSDYLTIARDGTKANYNIKRNFSYEYVINIPTENRELNIYHAVNPWIVSNYDTNFDEPQVKLVQDNNSILEKLTIETDDVTPLNFKLNIKNSNGAVWKIALSNGADFELRPSSTQSEIPAIMGVADGNTTYGFSLHPLKPYQGSPRYTELYLIVNNQEKSLYNDSETGPGNRILIKQVFIKN